jgi:hypothetical protein
LVWNLLLAVWTMGTVAAQTGESDLEQGFADPPAWAKPRVYWWWLYNRVDQAGITRDLEEFKAKGIGGVNLICTGGYAGKEPLLGVEFLGPEWRALFRHAVQEADRLKIEMGFNLAGGWVMIGPWVTPDNAMKQCVQAEVSIRGPQKFASALPQPKVVDGYYRDVWVQAFRIQPNTRALDPKDALDLTERLRPDGWLEWDVPEGEWTILRTGYTLTGSKWGAYPAGDTFSGGEGYQIDYLNTSSLDDHFAHLGTLVLEEARRAGGRLAYLWSDSWECGKLTWTQDFPAQFRRFRGYDLKPYMGALSGHIVVNPDVTARFRVDFDRTIQDCLAENFYGHFAQLCHERGLEMGSEAAGPGDIPPMDSLKNLGRCDVPAGEFWVNSRCKFAGGYNLNLRQTASAAHIYGKRQALAESFTQQERERTHWYYSPADLRPFGDLAFCEGINAIMLHQATCQLSTDGKPGYEFCAGQHWNPNITWWEQSGPYFAYLARCQYLLQQGLSVCDVCFYLGEEPPLIAPPKHDDPALGFGYDYDYCNAEVLLTRMSVKDGRIVLPDGMSYRLLVLQNCVSTSPEICQRISEDLGLPISTRPAVSMSVEVLRKIRELVRNGAMVVGPRPAQAVGLYRYPQCDAEVQEIAAEVWGDCDGESRTEHRFGRGRVIWGPSLREILKAAGVKPDFSFPGQAEQRAASWIWHAADGDQPPACERLFRTACTIPVDRKVASAWVGLAVDNAFELEVNGSAICHGADWRKLVAADLTRHLVPGANTLVVRAKNTAAGPAGLLLRGQITFDRGTPLQLVSDGSWSSSQGDDVWTPVRVVGAYGTEPWGDIGAFSPALDFVHRVVGETDLYFVANRADHREVQDCTFRVDGKQPELWDPVNGDVRAATAFKPARGSITLPLEFEPHGSIFLVFRKPIAADAGGQAERNFPALSVVQDLGGPWTVRFDPQWGGPASVEFPELISWTKRPEEGIKYYSGKATYQKTFDLPARAALGAQESPEADSRTHEPGARHVARLYLDLGSVQHVAEVRLNGKKVGVLWTAPWRVEITNAARSSANVLEVDVINLWANRVIGDLNLPKDKRIATTHDTFRFDMLTQTTALLDSGLLGPVTVLREDGTSATK